MCCDTRFWGGILILCLIATGVEAADRAILTTTDFSSGSIAVVDLETFVATENVLNIHSDAGVQFYNGRVYVINRLGQDNILVLNPEDLSKPERQFSVGNGTNPQAIAFVSDSKAYVTRYESTHLLMVNPSTGDSLGSVDLSGFADSDGIPEMSQMAIWQEQLYVLCQRLDRNNGFAPTDRSEVAVVDVNTDALKDMNANEAGVQGIVLALKNPTDAFQVQGKFYLSCVGSFTEFEDGGIEVLNLAENTSEGVVVGGTELGGNPGALAVGANQKGYAVVSDATFANTVRPFDASAKTVSAGLSGISGGFVPDLGILNGRLYVADQGSFTDPASAGFRVYDTQTDLLVAGPIATGLPPSDIAFITETQDQPTTTIPSDPVEAADFSGDGTVDFNDFLFFAQNFGKSSDDSDFNARIDITQDGKVDFADFLAFAQQFGKQVGG
ncbi:MAG: hypothetical protein O7G87_03240 [bacterium]|nr:hypothetical protein [bacterium]